MCIYTMYISFYPNRWLARFCPPTVSWISMTWKCHVSRTLTFTICFIELEMSRLAKWRSFPEMFISNGKGDFLFLVMARTAPFAAGVCYSIFHPTWWPNPLQTQTSGQRGGSNPFRGILELHQIIECTKKWVGNHSTLDTNQNKHEQRICHYIYISVSKQFKSCPQIVSLDSCSFQLLPISNIHLAHSFGCPSSFNQKLKAKEDTGQTIQASMRTILGLRPIISWSCWRVRSCLV